MSKYRIGDLVADEEGNSGIVCIKWDDGDICTVENDAAHPNPIIVAENLGGEAGNSALCQRPFLPAEDRNKAGASGNGKGGK